MGGIAREDLISVSEESAQDLVASGVREKRRDALRELAEAFCFCEDFVVCDDPVMRPVAHHPDNVRVRTGMGVLSSTVMEPLLMAAQQPTPIGRRGNTRTTIPRRVPRPGHGRQDGQRSQVGLWDAQLDLSVEMGNEWEATARNDIDSNETVVSQVRIRFDWSKGQWLEGGGVWI